MGKFVYSTQIIRPYDFSNEENVDRIKESSHKNVQYNTKCHKIWQILINKSKVGMHIQITIWTIVSVNIKAQNGCFLNLKSAGSLFEWVAQFRQLHILKQVWRSLCFQHLLSHYRKTLPRAEFPQLKKKKNNNYTVNVLWFQLIRNAFWLFI